MCAAVSGRIEFRERDSPIARYYGDFLRVSAGTPVQKVTICVPTGPGDYVCCGE
jgi:hypothetical protein